MNLEIDTLIFTSKHMDRKRKSPPPTEIVLTLLVAHSYFDFFTPNSIFVPNFTIEVKSGYQPLNYPWCSCWNSGVKSHKKLFLPNTSFSIFRLSSTIYHRKALVEQNTNTEKYCHGVLSLNPKRMKGMHFSPNFAVIFLTLANLTISVLS